MIACRAANNPLCQFRTSQRRKFVIGAPQLERKYGLQILPLHQDPVADASGQVVRKLKRRYRRNVVNGGLVNELGVLGEVHAPDLLDRTSKVHHELAKFDNNGIPVFANS